MTPGNSPNTAKACPSQEVLTRWVRCALPPEDLDSVTDHVERLVALKVLSSRYRDDPAIRARFSREMKAIGRFDHPHVVRATDGGDKDGFHFLVMDYIEGLDLARLADALGPLPAADACEL